jgi:uncharacterized protein (DUF2342 family)
MFAIHLLITAAIAPALGVAASSVFGAFDHGRVHPEQALAALLGGFIALAFIWFITLPVGAFTYVVCRFAAHRRLLASWLWLLVWCGLGAGFGLAMGRWSASLSHITTSVGAVVGLLTGIVLHRLWSQEVSRAA